MGGIEVRVDAVEPFAAGQSWGEAGIGKAATEVNHARPAQRPNIRLYG